MLSISGRQISHDLRQSLHCSRLLLTLRISRSSPFASWPWQHRSKMHMNLFTLNSVPTSQTILGFIIGQTTLLNLPNPLYTDSSACASLKNSLQMSTRILAQDSRWLKLHIYIYVESNSKDSMCMQQHQSKSLWMAAKLRQVRNNLLAKIEDASWNSHLLHLAAAPSGQWSPWVVALPLPVGKSPRTVITPIAG